jgi:purine-binding chemotaxis protein CheW
MHKQVCTFTVGELFFGIDVLTIQEVLSQPTMTRVPLAPSIVRGLINLRGQILTVFDLRERLRMAPRPAESTGMSVVVQLPDGAVTLLVDQVGEVLDLAEDQFEASPATLPDTLREVTRGVYKLKDRLLLLLDVSAAVTPASKVSA